MKKRRIVLNKKFGGFSLPEILKDKYGKEDIDSIKFRMNEEFIQDLIDGGFIDYDFDQATLLLIIDFECSDEMLEFASIYDYDGVESLVIKLA